MGPALSYLEQRQEWVLDQISQLQKRVKDLGQKLGVGPDEVGVLSQVREVHFPLSLSPPFLLIHSPTLSLSLHLLIFYLSFPFPPRN